MGRSERVCRPLVYFILLPTFCIQRVVGDPETYNGPAHSSEFLGTEGDTFSCAWDEVC